MTKFTRTRTRRGFSALGGAMVLLGSLVAPLEAAERTATSSRSGSVSRSDISTKTSSGSSASSTRSGASSTRSGGSVSGGTATRRSGGRSSGRHYPSDRYYYSGRYNHRSYWGTYFGFYPWWGGYYSSWGYPHYPISPYLYYGPHPGEYRGSRLGALDLNVKPKKAEVWVDGQFVGTSGKFDGFPGYLWLERGRHQLVLHRPGFETEVREVRVLQGTVVKVNLRLQEGETVPPEALMSDEYVRRRRPARRATAAAPTDDIAAPEPRRSERKVSLEPGRLLLSIEPGDASVYLDGRFLGTADELSRLHAGLLVNAGNHTLEVVRPGFVAERMEMVIEPDTETSLTVELDSNTSSGAGG